MRSSRKTRITETAPSGEFSPPKAKVLPYSMSEVDMITVSKPPHKVQKKRGPAANTLQSSSMTKSTMKPN